MQSSKRMSFEQAARKKARRITKGSEYVRQNAPISSFAMRASVVRGRGIRGETKYVDCTGGGNGSNTVFGTGSGMPGTGGIVGAWDIPVCSGTNTASFQLLNAVQEGAGPNNRIGRKIAMKSLLLRYAILPIPVSAAGGQPTSDLAPDVIRVMVVYDKQPNGSAPTQTTLIQGYDQSNNASCNVLDGLNMNNRDRFVVLRDDMIGLPAVNASGINASQSVPLNGDVMRKHFIPLGNMEAQYNGTVAPLTISSFNTGALFLFYMSNGSNSAPTVQYRILWTTRLRFEDN